MKMNAVDLNALSALLDRRRTLFPLLSEDSVLNDEQRAALQGLLEEKADDIRALEALLARRIEMTERQTAAWEERNRALREHADRKRAGKRRVRKHPLTLGEARADAVDSFADLSGAQAYRIEVPVGDL